jgi:hypothetical protein
MSVAKKLAIQGTTVSGWLTFAYFFNKSKDIRYSIVQPNGTVISGSIIFGNVCAISI